MNGIASSLGPSSSSFTSPIGLSRPGASRFGLGGSKIQSLFELVDPGVENDRCQLRWSGTKIIALNEFGEPFQFLPPRPPHGDLRLDVGAVQARSPSGRSQATKQL